MSDSELDQLERDLTQAAEIWFSAPLHMKLARLIEIARSGESAERAKLEAERSLWRVVQAVSEQYVTD